MSSHTKAPALAYELVESGWQVIRVNRYFLGIPYNAVTRYRSPYTGKQHKLHKALRKERHMQQVTQTLFI